MIQLAAPDEVASLVFVYRLEDVCAQGRFPMSAIDPAATYVVTDTDDPAASLHVPGSTLRGEGLHVHLPRPNSAKIIVVQRRKPG